MGRAFDSLEDAIKQAPDAKIMPLLMVCGFILNKSRTNVLLILKDGKTVSQHKGKWNGIGGKIEVGESPEEAMSRECLEETGLEIVPEVWTEIISLKFTQQGLQPAEVFFFMATETDLEMNHAKSRCHDHPEKYPEPLRIFPVLSLPEVIYNLHWLIPLAADTEIMLPLGIRGCL